MEWVERVGEEGEREKARDDWWVRREKPDVPKGASWWDRLLSGKLGRWLELVRSTLDHFPSVACWQQGKCSNTGDPDEIGMGNLELLVYSARLKLKFVGIRGILFRG